MALLTTEARLNMLHWSVDSVFYQLLPLDCFGAPEYNDFRSSSVPRIEVMSIWADYLLDLGVNAICLGPVFESSRHGYDIANYFQVDRRLGTNADLKNVCEMLHRKGLKVILDGVFHHVGRDFPQFKDVQINGSSSPFADWFFTRFDRQSVFGDRFFYEGWNECYDLVKLNVHNDEVKQHLFDAVRFWISEFEIDGLRLDAADVLDLNFQREMANHCRSINPEFWLFGEVIHGDYRRWANIEALDSATNYELYKGFYSSHNDKNYFEIAHSLNREFGADGLYREIPLYNFVDNHDVDRIASLLNTNAHLYPLHILLFTVPGLPSIYYGSEVGQTGKKSNNSDAALRPALSPSDLTSSGPHPNLRAAVKKLIALRKEYDALRRGIYKQLHVSGEQFVFTRQYSDQLLVIAVNASNSEVSLNIQLPESNQTYLDLLQEASNFTATGDCLNITVPPCWGRILARKR
jgi:glycosidase